MSAKLETVEDLSERLQVDKTWIYERTRTGEIPHIKLGPRYIRFESEVIDEWLKNQRQEKK